MKRIVLLLSMVGILTTYGYAQYEAVLSLPQIEVEALNAGDEIVVPLRLVSTTPDDLLIVNASLSVNFDETIIDFVEMQNFHPSSPYGPDWTINNGIIGQCNSIWADPTFLGVDFEDNAIFYELAFTYLGELEAGEESPITWSENSSVFGGNEGTMTLIHGRLCNGCGTPSSISESVDKIKEVEIYSHEKTIYVNIDNPASASIIVYDLLGHEVLRTDVIQGKNTIRMEQGNYYIVSVVLDDKTINTKMFVQ